MPEPVHWRQDRLAPQSVHDLLGLLTAIRGEEHMVRRWVRLQDGSDDQKRVLDRLVRTDVMIRQLATELIARAHDDDTAATPTQ